MSRHRLHRVVLAVLVFVASLVAFDRLLFGAFQRLQEQPDGRPEMRRKLETLPDKPRYQMLVLGTSRTFEAVHPAIIHQELGIRSFKEAFQGKGPRYNFEFYELYKQIVGKPRWIVYGVDYFLFDIQSEKWAMDRFAAARDARPAANGGPLLMAANKRTNDALLLNRLERLQHAWFPEETFDPERRVTDMEAYTGSAVSKITSAEVPAAYERIPFRRFPGREGEYFVKLLKQWEDEGVGVLLVNPPDYVATYETDYERREFLAYFNDLTARFRNCTFLNYDDPRVFPLNDRRYFIDGGYGNPNSHLSKPGVERFNRLFIPDLRRFVGTSAQTR